MIVKRLSQIDPTGYDDKILYVCRILVISFSLYQHHYLGHENEVIPADVTHHFVLVTMHGWECEKNQSIGDGTFATLHLP